MPGFATHYLFGVQMYRQIENTKIKKMLLNNLGPYRFGVQGPDMFFYNIMQIIGADENNIGKLMHEKNSNTFFKNYLMFTEKLRLPEDRETALSYLYGFICHYALDTIVHPYVYFRSNHCPTRKNSSKESFSMHTYIEAIMDTLLLNEHLERKPSNFHQTRTLSLSKREYHLISSLLVKTINETYFKKNNKSKQISRFTLLFSIASIKLETWFLHDKTGIKKRLTYLAERYVTKHIIVSNLISANYYGNSVDANNTRKKKWHNPWDTSVKSNQSVHELIEEAGKKYKDYENALTDYAIEVLKKPRKAHTIRRHTLLEALGNLSYHSGLDCDID